MTEAASFPLYTRISTSPETSPNLVKQSPYSATPEISSDYPDTIFPCGEELTQSVHVKFVEDPRFRSAAMLVTVNMQTIHTTKCAGMLRIFGPNGQ